MVAVLITSLCISPTTRGELLFGLAKRPNGQTPRRHGAPICRSGREFLRRVDFLPWETATSVVYEPARAATKREGRARAPMDLLIGLHALNIDAVPVTNDRAMAQVPGLSVEDWTAEC